VNAVVLIAVLKLGLRLEVGLEYDSNANRSEVISGTAPIDPPQGSPLLRTMARGQLTWRRGASTLWVQGTLGGKAFFLPSVADQNMLVGQLSLDERLRASRVFHLGLGLDYYDAGQLTVDVPCGRLVCNRHRDFRTGGAALRLFFLPRGAELSVGGGYRGFQYKPEPGYDFNAPQLSASMIVRRDFGASGDHELDLGFSYQFERRFFDANAAARPTMPGCDVWTSPPPNCVPTLSNDSRTDWFHQVGVDLTYVGRVLVGVGYVGQLNDSNSFQQTFYRHLVSLKIGFAMPWQLYATLKAQLMATLYKDPVLLDQRVQNQTFVTAEDENRNAIIADLDRPIGNKGVSMNVRYSFFTNQISASPAAFMRHVVTLGFAYRVGR
jgi:hypothetical protein